MFNFLRRSSDEKKPPAPWDNFWFQGLSQSGSTAGQNVTATSAQRLAATWACQTAIEESIAMLPATVYSEADERKKEKQTDHPLFQLIRHAPNELMDSFTFCETMQQNLLSEGNAYAHIMRTKGGWISQLLPLAPERVRFELKDNRIVYEYTDPTGSKRTYSQSDIFHLRYKSRDGIVGRSPITAAAQVFGLGLALSEHGARSFENGAFMSGFVKVPHRFETQEAADRFIDTFKRYLGIAKTGGIAVLEQGADYVPHQMNNRDAQYLELLNASVLDICRIYRMPPVMIQVMDKGMAYASVEQLLTIFVSHTIQPHTTRWERAIKFQLLNRKGEEDLFVRFNISALIRGDLKSRTESIVQQLQYGLKTINEARNMLDENAIDDEIGDEVLISHNLIPASQVGKVAPPALQTPTQDQLEPKDSPGKGETVMSDADDEERFKPLARALIGRVFRREQMLIDKGKLSLRASREGHQAWSDETLITETLDPLFIAAKKSERFTEFRAHWHLARVNNTAITEDELVKLFFSL